MQPPTQTKTYLLKNLCCAHCADAIEREVSALASAQGAQVDYPNKTITVTFDVDEETMFNSIATIASEIDEDIVTQAITQTI
ncbi:MAG: heavy-metal-associated domain-containing protein [Coriobacteriales bacterium]|jgi:copper chaperone CopZ|nr:heavy-metal-associated domain-containing protein [Coriobacteriales bacterium]